MCADLIEHYDLAREEAASLLHRTGLYLQAHARYTEAERFYQQALAISRKTLPADHPNTATTLHELARLYWNQGKYEQAEPLYQQVLAIYRKSLPADHPSTGITIQSYASLLRRTKREQEAAALETRTKTK